MPSAHRQPVIVEVRPDVARMSPSPPSSPGKTVRFPQADMVAGVTRPLTPTEAWSLYYFETHARKCSACHRPYQVLVNGDQLCSEGHSLACDVTMHVYYKDGQIYSTIPEDRRAIRVEVPPTYDQIMGLLKGIDRRRRHHRKSHKPVISYEARAPAVQPAYETVTLTPSRARKHRETKYDTIIIGREDDDDNDKLARHIKRDEKRGSLYKDAVQQQPRKEYLIEVRAPEDHGRRRHKGFHY